LKSDPVGTLTPLTLQKKSKKGKESIAFIKIQRAISTVVDECIRGHLMPSGQTK
jgi:hypothetical protein